jgi:hypothetical protein
MIPDPQSGDIGPFRRTIDIPERAPTIEPVEIPAEPFEAPEEAPVAPDRTPEREPVPA